MAWISEIHYQNTYAANISTSEYVEFALSPEENLRASDFVFAAYDTSGAFNRSVNLGTLTPAVDPSNGHYIYRVTIRVTDPDTITVPGSGGINNEVEAIALVDTSLPNPVLDFYDIGGGVQNITAIGGPAAGAVSQNTPGSALNTSIQFDRYGNRLDGGVTPNRAVVCFASGTLIDTENGPRTIETLNAGDTVRTANGALCEIRWIGSRLIEKQELAQNPKLYPVRITAGALGNGLPHKDLLVSRQHRIVVSSAIAQQISGSTDVLIPAIRLTALPGVFVDETLDSVSYHHILFEDHKILVADGVQAESMLPGQQAMQSLSPRSKDEILALFPELANENWKPAPALIIPESTQQKLIVAALADELLALQA